MATRTVLVIRAALLAPPPAKHVEAVEKDHNVLNGILDVRKW